MTMNATTFETDVEQRRIADQPASPVSRESSASQNVRPSERLFSVGGGGFFLLHGLRHGGISGLISAGIGAMLLHRGVTGYCPLYEKLGIDPFGKNPPDATDFYERGIHVSKAYTINKPRQELFQFWRNFENLPKFMTHLEEVKVLDEKRSHWKARGPAGFSVEWDAEIINEEQDSVISWRSLEGADVHNAGSVRFIDTGDRGTEVRVVLNYLPMLGKLGAAIARVFGEEPSQQLQEDLRHFKQLMETGELPTNQGPHGSCRAASSNGGVR
jgi:uncharacterized membrane protein